jgi:hypothetical protein
MMMKQIVITSINPEAFIKSDSSTCTITLSDSTGTVPCIYFNSLFVNKLLNDGTCVINLSGNESVNRIYVESNVNCSFTISFGTDNDYTVSFFVIESNLLPYKTRNVINTDMASFMLLRTNPKLTGNVKLVVDSDNNMFLDTFKINDKLSENKYRKVKVSNNSYYSNDVRNCFGDIPVNEFYDIPEPGKNLYNVYKQFENQIIDIYSYGAKNNTDKLYTENFSIFAPLWLNRKLPDFFLVFRIDGSIDIDENINNVERFKKMLSSGEIIKSFDLRANTGIGNYLRNMQSEIDTYLSSANIVYPTFEKETDIYSNVANMYNTWFGISRDCGVVTTVEESIYEYQNIKNQVSFDEYITSGYKRNNLVNPYIVNFEFMFNDDLYKSEFKMNRYFGLYISNNEYNEVYPLLDENKLTFFKKDGSIIDYLNLFDNDNKAFTDKADRIFNITCDASINGIIRLNENTNENDMKKFANLPYKNVISAQINDKFETSCNKFMTINVNYPIKCGEHLRIITKATENLGTDVLVKYYIHEVIASKINNDNYRAFYNKENHEIINTIDGVEIHRNIFTGVYTNSALNNSEIIKEQIYQIANAISKMTNKNFSVSYYDDNSISFISDNMNNSNMTYDLYFERISSDIINDDYELTPTSNDAITYFNGINVPYCIYDITKKNIYDARDDIFKYACPYNFEVWNNRLIYLLKFTQSAYTPLSEGNKRSMIYSFDKTYYKNIDANILARTIYFNGTAYEYRYDLLNKYEIKYHNGEQEISYTDVILNVIKSPLDHKKYLINTWNKIVENNNIINLYSIAPIQFNIAGIMPIKDFNFNVLDKMRMQVGANTEYYNAFSDGADNEIMLNYNDVIKLVPSYKYVITLPNMTSEVKTGIDEFVVDASHAGGTIRLDGNAFYVKPIEKKERSFESYNDYIGDNYVGKNTVKIPLVTPTNCKWKLNGNDAFGNKIKVVINNNAFNGTSLNIPTADNDKLLNLFGYATLKTLSDNAAYNYNDIHDIQDGISLKERILNGDLQIIDLFNSNSSSVNTKFVTLSYNKQTNNLECIIFGKKISLVINKDDEATKYNNYLFTIVTSNAQNDNKVEFIIDENAKMILCIWYNTNIGLYNNKNVEQYLNNGGALYKYLNMDAKLSGLLNEKSIYITNNIYNDDEIKKNDGIFFAGMDYINKQLCIEPSYTYYIPTAEIENANKHSISIKNTMYRSYSDQMNSYTMNEDCSSFIETHNKIYEYGICNENKNVVINCNKCINTDFSTNNISYVINNGVNVYKNLFSIKFDDTIVYNNDFKNNNESIYTYNGNINPEFVDIFTFYDNEESDIIDITKCNYVSGNTRIKNINNIKQLWINKVFNSNNDKRNLSCIDVLYDYDITKSLWKNSYYRNYTSDVKYKRQSGMSLGLLTKSFFNSFGIVIPNGTIVINDFSESSVVSFLPIRKTYNNSSDEIPKYSALISLTTAATKLIKRIINDDVNDAFIRNNILNVFNINNKNAISVYRRPKLNNSSIIVAYDANDKSFEQVNNIKMEMQSLDDNYLLSCEIPQDNYQYAFVYKITK